jgi:hypothetical protein
VGQHGLKPAIQHNEFEFSALSRFSDVSLANCARFALKVGNNLSVLTYLQLRRLHHYK